MSITYYTYSQAHLVFDTEYQQRLCSVSNTEDFGRALFKDKPIKIAFARSGFFGERTLIDVTRAQQCGGEPRFACLSC